VAFTGSATEAINWALKGTVEKARNAGSTRNRIITLATEHAAVLDTCEWLSDQGTEVTVLPVQRDGLIDLEVLADALDRKTLLVAVMSVNNEIGVLQPMAEIAAMAKKAGALTFCDAVQAFGRVEIPKGVDLVAVSAHKIYGPKGIGALWMRKGAEPAALIHGGGQELGLRSGTLSPALCVGFGAAAKLAEERVNRDYDHVRKLWATASQALGLGWVVNGVRSTAIPATSISAGRGSTGHA
jgi:cysteine desulfurase